MMPEAIKNNKYRYAKLILALLVVSGFVLFSAIKVEAIKMVYENGNQKFQDQMKDKIHLVRSGQIELDQEKIANLMEATTRRDFEEAIIYRLAQYLSVFIILFGLSSAGLIVVDFLRVECKKRNTYGGD